MGCEYCYRGEKHDKKDCFYEQMKNKTAHTPGPWHADKCTMRQGYTIGQTATKEHPATLQNIAQVVDGPESEANARLIAASPELLANLISSHASEIQFRNHQSMVEHRKEWPKGCSACDAIAKAEGGAQ